jgi:hypothetical protein
MAASVNWSTRERVAWTSGSSCAPFLRDLRARLNGEGVGPNYRMEMLSQAGIAIFLFGNKQDDAGRIVDADRMEEEFRLAADAGLKVLPIGCTGHVAAKLHKEVLATFSNYYPMPGIKQLFTALGKRGTPKQVADRIVAIVRKIRVQNN